MVNHIKQLENLDNILSKIDNPNVKIAINLLFNIVEEQASEIQQLRIEKQNLKDEIAMLKGEQPKPKIKPNNKNNRSGNISSEKERNGAAGAKDKNKKIEGPKKIKLKLTEPKYVK